MHKIRFIFRVLNIKLMSRIAAKCLDNIEVTMKDLSYNRQQRRQFWRGFIKSDSLRRNIVKDLGSV